MADTNENNQYGPSINWNHSQDIIFTEESLEEFIRLIRRGGLEGLQVYSIYDELLKHSETYEDKNSPILDGEHKEFRGARPWTAASNSTQLATQFAGNYRAYFVIVKTNIPLDDNFEENNILSGRHKYIKAGDEIELTTGDIKGTVKFFKNGKPKDVFVKGLENFGSANATTFLRGDGTWNNFLTGSIYAGSNNYTKDFSSLSGQKNAGAVGPSGSIYFFSESGKDGANKRGIAGYNQNETGTQILYVNQDNIIHSCPINPKEDNKYDLGSPTLRWKNIYGNILDLGTAASENGAIYINGKQLIINNMTKDTAAHFWRGDGCWSDSLIGPFNLVSNSIEKTNNYFTNHNGNQALWITGLQKDSTTNTAANTLGCLGFWSNLSTTDPYSRYNATVIRAYDYRSTENNYTQLAIRYKPNVTDGTGFANYNCQVECMANNKHDVAFRAAKVFNAVFNDYAEYRTTIDLDPGRVVIDNDNGSLSCAYKRLQPGAQVISDTFGHSMGETDQAQTPIAVAGRVLVYTYQPRENYHAGMAVCSAPGGTVDIMTREEVRDYPDCIIGIVSEIPEYETWGTDNVKVDGRIWIKVK